MEQPPRYEDPKDYEAFFAELFKKAKGQFSLLGQVSLDEEAVRHIGSRLRVFRNYASHYPYTLSLYLTWCGILDYEGGNYWDPVCEATGLPKIDRDRWGQIFEWAISKLGLPAFKDEKTYRYVTPILAHGGIPKSCLPDFFENLLLPAVDGNFGDLQGGEILMEWRSDPDLVDFRFKTVARFLQKGGRAAEDFLERCVRMAEQVVDDPDRVLPAGALGLPPHVVEAFQEWMQKDRPIGPGRLQLRRPFLQLQPGSRLVLHLPVQRLPLEGNKLPRLQWQIGNLPLRPCAPHDGGSCIETVAEAFEWTEAREPFSCSLLRDGQTLRRWDVEAFVASNQSTVFIDPSTGRAWSLELLPRGDIWVLGSGTLQGTGFRVVEELPALNVDGTPWPLRWLDLTKIRGPLSVNYKPFSCEPAAPWLEGGARIVGVETSRGYPVYRSVAPDLCIPRDDQTGLASLDGWSIALRPLPYSHPSAPLAHRLKDLSEIVRIKGSVVRVPIERLLPADALGRFEVTLTGSLGQDRSFTFAMVPEFQFSWRADEGEPVVEITCPASRFCPESSSEAAQASDSVLIPSSPRLRFVEGALETSCGDAEIRVPLRLWVPLPRWRISGVSEADPGWARTLQLVPLESVTGAKDANLWVELPANTQGAVTVALEMADETLQETRSATGPRGEVCIPLGAFKDTLRQPGRHSVRFTLQYVDGQESRKLTILALRSTWAPPDFDASYAQHDGTRALCLSWEASAVVTSRAVRLQSLWKPTCEPVEVMVPDGAHSVEVALVPGKTDPGRYLLEFTIHDPWFSSPAMAGDSRHLDLLPQEWERHLLQGDATPAARLERLLAVLDCPATLQTRLGSPETLAAALCVPADLREVLGLLAHLLPESADRVWPHLIPHLPLDGNGVGLLLEAGLRGRHLVEVTIRAGLPQAQPKALEEAGLRRLREVWAPYGRLFAEQGVSAPTMADLVTQGPELSANSRQLLRWSADVAPRVRTVLDRLQGHAATRRVGDRLLGARRTEQHSVGRRTCLVWKYFEYGTYAGTTRIMAVREGDGVVTGRDGRLSDGRNLVPLNQIAGHSFFDGHFCARLLVALIALGQRSRARDDQHLAPLADLLRQLGLRCFQLDRNFYGDCLVAAESELRQAEAERTR